MSILRRTLGPRHSKVEEEDEHDLEELQDHQSGWLMKKALFKNKDVWCSVSGRWLSFWKDPSEQQISVSTKSNHVIDMCTAQQVMKSTNAQTPYGIDIIATKEKVTLIAKNLPDCERWITSLQAAMQYTIRAQSIRKSSAASSSRSDVTSYSELEYQPQYGDPFDSDTQEAGTDGSSFFYFGAPTEMAKSPQTPRDNSRNIRSSAHLSDNLTNGSPGDSRIDPLTSPTASDGVYEEVTLLPDQPTQQRLGPASPASPISRPSQISLMPPVSSTSPVSTASPISPSKRLVSALPLPLAPPVSPTKPARAPKSPISQGSGVMLDKDSDRLAIEIPSSSSPAPLSPSGISPTPVTRKSKPQPAERRSLQRIDSGPPVPRLKPPRSGQSIKRATGAVRPMPALAECEVDTPMAEQIVEEKKQECPTIVVDEEGEGAVRLRSSVTTPGDGLPSDDGLYAEIVKQMSGPVKLSERMSMIIANLEGEADDDSDGETVAPVPVPLKQELEAESIRQLRELLNIPSTPTNTTDTTITTETVHCKQTRGQHMEALHHLLYSVV